MQLQRFKSFRKDIWSVPSFRYESQGVDNELNIAFLLITKWFGVIWWYIETHAGDEENIKPLVGGSQVSGVPGTSSITRQTYGVAQKVKSTWNIYCGLVSCAKWCMLFLRIWKLQNSWRDTSHLTTHDERSSKHLWGPRAFYLPSSSNRKLQSSKLVTSSENNPRMKFQYHPTFLWFLLHVLFSCINFLSSNINVPSQINMVSWLTKLCSSTIIICFKQGFWSVKTPERFLLKLTFVSNRQQRTRPLETSQTSDSKLKPTLTQVFRASWIRYQYLGAGP